MSIQYRELEGHEGRYKVVERLGEGGFGTTYRAVRLEDGLQTALKRLKVERLDDWKSVELFERESEVLDRLDHPHIPDYVDHFPIGTAEAPEGLVLVQEFVPGTTLHEIMTSARSLSDDDMFGWFETLLEVCDYLHSLNPPVIHRDIQPNNIMLSESGEAYLIDFGTVQAKLASEDDTASTSAGTFGYAPMEQFVRKARPSSDLYSLAVTFIAVATGRPADELPFENGRFQVEQALTGEAFGPGVLSILTSMTEPDASKRFHSAEEVLRRLRSIRRDGAREQTASPPVAARSPHETSETSTSRPPIGTSSASHSSSASSGWSPINNLLFRSGKYRFNGPLAWIMMVMVVGIFIVTHQWSPASFLAEIDRGTSGTTSSSSSQRDGTPDRLTDRVLEQGKTDLEASIETCRKQQSEPLEAPEIRVSLKIWPNGTTTNYQLAPAHLRDTPFGRCMFGEQSSWTFGQFQGQPQRVTLDFERM